jgi:NADH-quinone oxidoreductase subunit N
VIGAYYYLRVVKLMYFDEPTENAPIEGSASFRVVLSANGLAVFLLGMFPGLLLALCARVLP